MHGSTLFCLASLATLASSEPACSAAEPLSLSVALSDPSPLEGDPVFVRLGVRNDSPGPLLVPVFARTATLALELRLPDQTLLAASDCAEPHGLVWKPRNVPVTELAPGQALWTLYELAEEFPIWSHDVLELKVVYGARAGAHFNDPSADKAPVAKEDMWSGRLESGWLRITTGAPSTGTALAIQELPTPPGSPLCLTSSALRSDEMTAFLSEHGATPLGEYVALRLAERSGEPDALEAWRLGHPSSKWMRLAEFLELMSAVSGDSGEHARERMLPGLLSDAFFGPLAAQLEPAVVELEAADAAWDIAWIEE